MKKLLFTAAGIVVALIAIGVIFFGTNVFKEKAETAVGEGAKMLDNAALASYTQKNGNEMNGSAVLNFITEKETCDDQVAIIVNNTSWGGNTVSYVYDSNLSKIDANTEAGLKKASKGKSNAAYLNPNNMYDVSLQYNQAGALISITFTCQ